MSDKPVSLGKSPEEVAFDLMQSIRRTVTGQGNVDLGKDDVLKLYAECLETVCSPSRHLPS